MVITSVGMDIHSMDMDQAPSHVSYYSMNSLCQLVLLYMITAFESYYCLSSWVTVTFFDPDSILT